MNSLSFERLVTYCRNEDPLKENWFGAQAAGLATSVAVCGCLLLSISNLVVITYTAIMSKLSLSEFDFGAYNSWQTTAATLAVIAGLAAAASAILYRVWFQSVYGSPVVQRNITLALNLEESIELCRHILPPQIEVHENNPQDGQITIHQQLDQCRFGTSHLIIRAIAINNDETDLMIDAVPVLENHWALLSAFYCDFGRNREQVSSIRTELRPYMASKKQRINLEQRRLKHIKRIEQAMKEAPPLIAQRGYN